MLASHRVGQRLAVFGRCFEAGASPAGAAIAGAELADAAGGAGIAPPEAFASVALTCFSVMTCGGCDVMMVAVIFKRWNCSRSALA